MKPLFAYHMTKMKKSGNSRSWQGCGEQNFHQWQSVYQQSNTENCLALSTHIHLKTQQLHTHTHTQTHTHIYIYVYIYISIWVSQVALVVKNPPANAGDAKDMDSIPGLVRSPREGYVNPLKYSCLENPTVRWAWWATVHGVTKSQTQRKWLSMHAHTHTHTYICMYVCMYVCIYINTHTYQIDVHVREHQGM